MLTFVIVGNDGFMAYLELLPDIETMKIIYQDEYSVIYADGVYCYKVFKSYDTSFCTEERLEILLHYRALFDSHFIIPDILYQKDNQFQAYRTLYLPNAYNFSQYFSNTILIIALKVDSLLRRLHRKGFTFCDFHFGNVLLNEKESPYLIDFDNVAFFPYTGERYNATFP